MFESNNFSRRPGGFRQSESPREQKGQSANGERRPRQRFIRTADGKTRAVVHDQSRPRFNPNARPGEQRTDFRRERPQYGERPLYSERPQFGDRTPRGFRTEGGERQPRQQFRPRPQRNKNVYSKKKRQEFSVRYEDPTKPMRLNKFLANAGICSRREADDFIQAGVISVNGEVVSSLGAKVLPTDKIMFHDQPVRREKKVYLLLNKPKNTVTTTEDPEERRTVMDIVRNACSERIYPVGRLDRNTTGVLLLTNDGDLASKLTHPKFGKKKIYAVTLDRDLEEADEAIIRAGIVLDDEKIIPDALEFPKEDRKHIGMEIHSGQNRVVRRIFEKVGYKVTALDRVSFAGLTKKNVGRGRFRFLTPKEVNMLQMGAFE